MRDAELIPAFQGGPEGPTRARGLAPVREIAIHAFHNLKTIVICLVAGILAGVAAAIFSPPRFTAESLVLVRLGAAEAAQEGLGGPQGFQSGEAVQRALNSEVRILRSDPVLHAALRRLSADGVFASGSRAEAAFARNLSVEIEDGSDILRIAFVSADRADALAAVEAVLDAYVERRAGLYVNDSRARQDGEIARYGRALSDTEARIQTIRQGHDVLDIDKDVDLASDHLAEVTRRLFQTRERRGAVAAELAAISRQARQTPDRVLDSQERTNATPNDEARNTLLRLRQDRAHVVEQYQSDWPGLAEIDARIAAAQAQIVENSQDIRSSDRTVRNPVADLLASRRVALTIEAASLERQAADLSVQLAAARERTAELRQAEMRLHDLERSRSATETIHRSLLIGRAGAALEDQAVDDRHAMLRVVQPATAPSKGRDLRPTLVLAGGVLGAAMAIAATAVAMTTRQVFVTTREAETALGLASLMVVDAGEADPRSEAGRGAAERLAARLLDQEIDGRPARVIQFLGDDAPASGRWALAAARAMAGRAGGPVLLIDIDAADHFRRKAGEAVQRLPAGAHHLDVARSVEPGLWAAVDPTRTPLAALGATLAQGRDFLDLMGGAFSRIIVAGGRDIEAPAARRLHALVDATVLVVTAEATRAPVARRIGETVLASGGDLLGFVFVGRRRHVPEALYRWL